MFELGTRKTAWAESSASEQAPPPVSTRWQAGPGRGLRAQGGRSLRTGVRGAQELGVKRQGGPASCTEEGAGSQGVGVFPTFRILLGLALLGDPAHPVHGDPELSLGSSTTSSLPCLAPVVRHSFHKCLTSYVRRCCLPGVRSSSSTRLHRGHPASGPERLPCQEPPPALFLPPLPPADFTKLLA